ncbi:MAG: MGMT family protein [Candidatus Zixiibacteriota bacterium]
MSTEFTDRVKRIIAAIPAGRVMTYGQIATSAGSPRGARQVVRVLHSCSEKDKLPWHRVVNGKGRIGLPRQHGYELQKAILEGEGVAFDRNDCIDLELYRWNPPGSKKP